MDQQEQTLQPQPFYVKDCTLAGIATGEKASSLPEFIDQLSRTHLGCIYFHFWGGRLRPQFTHPEFHNDFAVWALRSLNDPALAEKLGIIDPTEYEHLEQLRKVVLDVVEEHLEEKDVIVWHQRQKQFHFIRSKLMTFDTQHVIPSPADMKEIIPFLSPSSIFYHFIDARRRTPEAMDDLSSWLRSYGDQYRELIDQIQEIDIYFLSLTEYRVKLSQLIESY